MKVFCSICARGGSKGVKNKNLREVNGIPLLAHSINQAKASNLFSVITVSSDSQEILDCAKEFGADLCVKRPDELATDTAAKLPVIKHCLEEAEKYKGYKADIIFDLDATSPLRNIDDLKGVYELVIKESVTNVITGSPSRRSPYFNLVERFEDQSINLSKFKEKGNYTRRQDVPETYDMNASIYAWKRHSLLNEKSLFLKGTDIFVMPEERSLDIDSELDFKIVKYLMEGERV